MDNNFLELGNNPESKKQKPLNILVVEDYEGIADLVKDMLEDKGHKATVFTSKEEALEELRRTKKEDLYDWVITNRGFAERLKNKMDGITFAEKIREEKLGNPYITMLSRNAEVYSQEDIEKMGIQYAIGKPFKKEQLLGLVSVARQFRTQSENPRTA